MVRTQISTCGARRDGDSSRGESHLFASKLVDLRFDTQQGALAVFGELMQHADTSEKISRSGSDFFHCRTGVKVAKQTEQGLQGHRIRIRAEAAFVLTQFSNKPRAHQTTLHAVNLGPQRQIEWRPMTRMLDDHCEALLRVAHFQQYGQKLPLLFEQRMRFDCLPGQHESAEFSASAALTQLTEMKTARP